MQICGFLLFCHSFKYMFFSYFGSSSMRLCYCIMHILLMVFETFILRPPIKFDPFLLFFFFIDQITKGKINYWSHSLWALLFLLLFTPKYNFNLFFPPFSVCVGKMHVSLAEALEVRGGPLQEEEVWALLSQSAESLQELFHKGRHIS